jgi:hypothetical protein
MLVDAHVGILVDAHVGIWWIHFMMISFGTLLMYMGVVHGGNILVHDLLGVHIVHDYLFH